MKILFSVLLAVFVNISFAFSCEIPIENAQQAICHAQKYAIVISESSRYGYQYNTSEKDGIWKVAILETIEEGTEWVIWIRANDGEQINMSKIK